MPEFNEQIDAIERLRGEARRRGEALYTARVALQKARQRLERAENRLTIPDDNRDSDVSTLREQMAAAEARLAELRAQQREITSALAEIGDQRRLLAHLTERLAAATRRLAALQAQIAELQRSDSSSREELDRLRAERAATERARAQLEEAIRQATAEERERDRREAELRERQNAANRQMEEVRDDLRGVHDRIIERQRPATDRTEPIRADVEELEAAVKRNHAVVNRVKHELGVEVGKLYERDPHPRVPLARLNDDTPFILLPVRIETIFAPATEPRGNAGQELLVRVYPDEIAAHTHEATLTAREVEAGLLYWVELVVASHLRSERARRQQAAWRHLVDLFGGQRASWVARNTKPSDWSALSTAGETVSLVDFLDTADANFFDSLDALPLTVATRAALVKARADRDGDAFIKLVEEQRWGDRVNGVARPQITGFPTFDLTKTDAWSRAPRTVVLPDRFVLLLYATETTAPREIPGALIPDTVFLGPDPLDPDDHVRGEG